jgi:DNA-binding LacI/PurR family transcriptional regulator
MPTIADIARKAGVSKASVSYAFNDPSRLSNGTVERILAAAEELAYSPNPVARSMSIGRTGTLGVLVPQPLPEMLRNPFFAQFLDGVAQVAGEAELPLLLVPPIRGSMEGAISSAAVDGFLTLGLETFRPTMHVLERRRLPYVMVDGDPVDGVACVNIDDEGGAFQAMRAVLDRGHRRIGILGIRSPQRGKWEKYVGTLRRRMTGYVRALAEDGLAIDGESVRLTECDVSEEGGRAGFRRLRKRGTQPTAIVAMSDVIALGALEEALEAGIRVPDDLSFVGFDDIPEATWVRPALTTIRQPATEKGSTAAGLLVQLVNRNGDPRHVVLDTTLIERRSIGPATSG